MKLLAAVLMVFAVPAALAEVYVEKDRMYTGSDGTIHVVGEVRNGLDVPLGQILLSATIHDTHGNIIGTGQAWSLVNTLMPDMKTPFDVVISKNQAGQVSEHTLDVQYMVLLPKSQVIDITDSSVERSIQGDLYIAGKVVNRGDATANMISVSATIYNKEGSVATVARSHAVPDYLRSGHEGAFVVSIPERDQTDGMSGYALVAESEEYAAVPEFPLGASAVIVVSVAAYALFSRQSAVLYR